MKFKSQVLTQASGSIGGVVYSHNRGGLYQRARSIPVNPQTPAQSAARNAMSSASTIWSTLLSESQRMAWEEYAANSPVTDVFGDPLLLSGQQMYIRCMTPRLRIGEGAVFNGPTTFGLGAIQNTGINEIQSGGTTVDIEFDDSDSWANETGGFLIVQLGRQQSPTINYFRGPYRFAGRFPGDDITPPTSPDSVTNPFETNYTEGNKVFARIVGSLADGRLTNVVETSDLVITI